MKNTELFENALYKVLIDAKDDFDTLKEIFLNHLDSNEREEYEEIISGKKLPSLSSDIIAKKIFNPIDHSDRLEYLLREIAGDNTIQIDSDASSEGYVQSANAKKVIFDIPAHLSDGRIIDTEFQAVAQPFILKRGDIYTSDLLLVQYSTPRNQIDLQLK